MIRPSASMLPGGISSRLGLVFALVISLLFDPLTARLAWLNYKTEGHRKNVHCKIEKGGLREDLVLLKFDLAEAKEKVVWLTRREFRYENQLYDVVEMRQVGNTIEYLCWPDLEEGEIMARKEEFVELACHTEPEKRSCRIFYSSAEPDSFSKVLWAILTIPEQWRRPGQAMTPDNSAAVRLNSIKYPPPTPPPQLPG
ncbi:MAG: hypothetical protein ACPLRX_09455 [Candidatus Saccharicenans sp.]